VTGLVATEAGAGDDGGARRVRPLNVVSPRATAAPAGLTPAQVKAAYGFPTAYKAGAGKTIAIVIPYHHPTLEADLKVFSKTFGLRPCTRANYCLKIVNHRGGKDYPSTSRARRLRSRSGTSPAATTACPPSRASTSSPASEVGPTPPRRQSRLRSSQTFCRSDRSTMSHPS
jgi:hypothetical protein